MTDTSVAALAGAIAQLYHEFGDTPLGRPLSGCDHCTDSGDLARLANTPTRQLSARDLNDYLYSAMSTVGDEEDFRHFLPRLFELAVPDFEGPDFELVGAQLTRAKWEEWPDPQRAAVRRALEALWNTLESREYEDSAVDSLVCGVALARLDMLPLLTAWSRASNPIAKANLSRFFECNRDSLWRKRRLSNAFWEDSPAQEVVVADWLRSTMGVY